MIIKQILPKSFPYGFLDSTLGQPCIPAGRQSVEFDICAVQGQDAFGSQGAGNDVQARYFPVTGMSPLGKPGPAAMCPVVNAVQERIDGIPQLI